MIVNKRDQAIINHKKCGHDGIGARGMHQPQGWVAFEDLRVPDFQHSRAGRYHAPTEVVHEPLADAKRQIGPTRF